MTWIALAVKWALANWKAIAVAACLAAATWLGVWGRGKVAAVQLEHERQKTSAATAEAATWRAQATAEATSRMATEQALERASAAWAATAKELRDAAESQRRASIDALAFAAQSWEREREVLTQSLPADCDAALRTQARRSLEARP